MTSRSRVLSISGDAVMYHGYLSIMNAGLELITYVPYDFLIHHRKPSSNLVNLKMRRAGWGRKEFLQRGIAVTGASK